MPIDPNIPLAYHPQAGFGIINPLDAAAKRAEVTGAEQHNQIGAMQVQEQQRQMAEGQRMRDVFAQNPDIQTAIPKIMAINPQVGIGMSKSLLDNTHKQLDIAKTGIENNAASAKRLGSIAGGIKDETSFHSGIATALKENLIDAGHAQAFITQGYNPETQKQIDQLAQNGLTVEEQKKDSLAQLEEKRKQADADHKRRMEPFQEQEQSAKAATAGMEFAARTVGKVGNQPAWNDWLKTLPPSIAAQVGDMYSPAAVKQVQNMAFSPKDLETAKERNRHNVEMEPAGQFKAMMDSLGGGAPSAPTQAPATGGPQIPAGTLAANNNNPLNLRFAGQPGATEGEGGFARFANPAAGEQAGLRQIKLDQGRPLTVGGYIAKFAPPAENDTESYISNAEKALGVPRDTPLANVEAGKILQFQMKQESGATPGQPSALPAAQSSTPGATPAPPSANGRDESALQNVNPAIANKVRAISAGRMQPPPQGGRGPIGMLNQSINQLLMRYDPGFDFTNAGLRMKTANDFGPGGASGKSINAIDTAFQHAGDLSDLVEGLNNTNYRKYNTFTNWIQNEKGSPEVKRFENVRGKFAEELTRAWRGSGGAEADLQRELSVLNAADSPTTLRNVIADDVNLLMAKYGASKHQYEGNMGFPLPEAKGISKEAQAAAQKITGRRGGSAKVAVVSPEGVAGTIDADKWEQAQKRGFKKQ